MAGISYGKGAVLPEGKVRWLSPDDLDGLVAAGKCVRFFDARDEREADSLGTIPGAESLAQSTLMFTVEKVQPLLNALVAGDYGGADELVFFANTAGVAGVAAGREVWVMAYLVELGVPLERMARLSGGFFGWRDSGREIGSLSESGGAVADGLDGFLEERKLGHLSPCLAGRTLRELAAALDASRPAFLGELKALGVGGLADRQALSNALSKARREGTLPP